ENKEPVVATRGISKQLTGDMYTKAALFLHTLRSVVNDDEKWWKLLHGFYQHFKYQNIMTEDVEAWFSKETGMDLTPVFNQYLRHTAIPKLEIRSLGDNSISYRWIVDEPGFAMPVRIGTKDHWQVITPTTKLQTMRSDIKIEDLEAATDLYYIDLD